MRRLLKTPESSCLYGLAAAAAALLCGPGPRMMRGGCFRRGGCLRMSSEGELSSFLGRETKLCGIPTTLPNMDILEVGGEQRLEDAVLLACLLMSVSLSQKSTLICSYLYHLPSA
jgi:hypothetical protein